MMNTGVSNARRIIGCCSYATAPRYPNANRLSSARPLSLVPTHQSFQGSSLIWTATTVTISAVLTIYMAPMAGTTASVSKPSPASSWKTHDATPVDRAVSPALNGYLYHGRTKGGRLYRSPTWYTNPPTIAAIAAAPGGSRRTAGSRAAVVMPALIRGPTGSGKRPATAMRSVKTPVVMATSRSQVMTRKR